MATRAPAKKLAARKGARAASRTTGSREPLTGALGQVAAAFTLEAHRSGLVPLLDRLTDPAAFGAALVRVAAARATFEVAVGGHLTVADTVALLGVSRQAIHQRIARGSLVAMDVAGQTLLPPYQFDGDRVRPEVGRAARLLAPAELSDVSVVSWFATGQPELEGETPAGWLAAGRDAARVYEAARHTAGELSH
jgi:hypothetical protein